MGAGLLDRLVATRNLSQPAVRAVTAPSVQFGGSTAGNFVGLTGAYTRNATVNAGLELLATSAAEPKIIGIKRRRPKGQIRAQTALWTAQGIRNKAGAMVLDAMLAQSGFTEELPDHPLVKLLNNPNPFLTGDELWGTVVIDRWLAGNCYILKGRTDLGNVAELWRLRPDRVEIIPDRANFIAGYRYKVGQETFVFPRRDVMHFKTRNPLDPYYGLPLLLPIIDMIDIDNDMKVFLKTFFRNGGSGPGSILTVKTGLTDDEKEEIRDRKRRIFGGPAGAHEMLILDNTETTYTQLGLDRGLRDALPKEIAAMVSAELSMCLGIPASILGQLIGLESSSYANKRADWQVLWDVNLTPLMGGLGNVINRAMLSPDDPEFGGIDEIQFDLSTIRALQEDEDALQERARKNFSVGIWSFEETRLATGMDPNPKEGTFFVAANMVPTPIERLGEEPAPAAPVQVGPPDVTVEPPANLGAQIVAAMRTPRVGRPPLLADPGARATFEKAEKIRVQNPSLTLAQVAARVGISERQYRRYRNEFGNVGLMQMAIDNLPIKK